jgi:hypothetical protein
MVVAPLSGTTQFGYYGLKVNPSFEQIVGSVRKNLRVPVPDRRWKWYALGPYRSHLLDLEAKYHDYEHDAINYKKTGHELPESAATIRRSDAGNDPMFDVMHANGDAVDAEYAHETAIDRMNEEHRRIAEENRSRVLGSHYGPIRGHPTVEASRHELDEALVPYTMYAPRPHVASSSWRAPVQRMAAAGQPQALYLKSFEQLNGMTPDTYVAGTLSRSQATTYEQVRDSAVAPDY